MQPARGGVSRQVKARLMLCDACRLLRPTLGDAEGYLDLELVVSHSGVREDADPISAAELEILLSTEGNRSNGGGVFDVQDDIDGTRLVRFTEDNGNSSMHGAVGAPGGGIGSPFIGGAAPTQS